MSSNSGEEFDNFIITEVERKTSKIVRTPKPFPPKIREFNLEDESDVEWSNQNIAEQVKNTVNILKKKKFRSEKQVFCVLGSNVDAGGQILIRFSIN